MLPDRQHSRASFRPIGAVVHAAQILEAVADDGGAVGVNELARRVGLDPSSVSRIVRTLELHRLVQRDEVTNRVALGTGLVALTSEVLHRLDVRQAAGLELDRLSAETRETINLGVWDEGASLIVDHRAGLEPIAALGWIGRRDPAHASSLGKALLAFQPDPIREAVVTGPLARFTPTTITGRAELRATLERVRESGYSVNRGELRDGLSAVAAPIFGLGDAVVAAVGIAGPETRLDEDRLIELSHVVRASAASLSRSLGASRERAGGARRGGSPAGAAS